MKNYPYNTGRTVTINLDNLGNADIWQLFTIVTAGTNNVFEGDEPDARPAADSDAAYEIFLHIAETADDRADGADAGQRDFLLGTKEEYLDIFGDSDGPANLPANEESADDADDDANDEDTRTGAEMYLDMATQAYLDAPENSNLEAALQANAIDTNNDPNNLYRAGVFAGLAEAAAWGIYATSKVDDIHAITAAIYKAYGVAY